MKGSQQFIVNQGSEEYLIKLKKKNYWWLLLFLLLLLPLILLIHFEKEVKFKIINDIDKAAISNADVKFAYIEREFIKFKGFSFFTSDKIQKQGKTDKDGIVIFQKVRYSLYSRLFYSSEKAFVSAASECFMGDSLYPVFHQLKDKDENLLQLPFRYYLLDFKVIDREDKQPIPGATVNIKIEVIKNDPPLKDSTNVNGVAVFKKLPYCANLVVIGSAYGYENDTLFNGTKHFVGSIDSLRRLRLKPLKKMVSFLVKNLKSKQPIADATVSMKIKEKTVVVRTNTNGVGKGAFEDVHVLADMILLAQKSFFYDTTKTDRVDRFIKQDEEYRTLYLRPRMQDIAFRDIDATTRQPIPGVRNMIIVNGVARPDPVYSNGNGSFSVAGVFGEDKISISASMTDYEDNNTTIQNRVFNELINGTQDIRDIPLKPIVIPPPPPPPPPTANENGLKGATGDLRINLQWNSIDDLDLYVTDPCNKRIFYRKRRMSCNNGLGTLDLDANVVNLITDPQENIYWNTPSKGTYVINVKFFKRNVKGGPPVNFNVTVIDKGQRHDFPSVAATPGNEIFVTSYLVN